MKNYKESYERWLHKKVLKKQLVFNPSKKSPFSKINGDKYLYEVNYEEFDGIDTLSIKYDSDISKTRRPTIGVVLPLLKNDLSEYNRVHVKVYVKAKGFRNLYMHYSLNGENLSFTHAPSLMVNKWEEVIWEANDQDLHNVKSISIVPFMGGCPSEGEHEITVFISKVFFEKVEKEYELGYELEDRIAFSQLGYFTKSTKEFLIKDSGVDFEILNKGEVVFKGKTKKMKTSIGEFGVGDFSSVNEAGKYKIRVNGQTTPLFEISNNPYLDGIFGSLYFLYQLRCGVNVFGVHSACHLNSKTYNEKGDYVPNFGGWHDAGDLSQFEIPTAEITSSLLELGFATGLNERVMEEARVGLDWLLRTTFHDGERALAVLYEKWWNNVECLDDSHYKNMSENGPFENFLACNALALGSVAFEAIDEVYANYCLKVAKEDFEFAYLGYKEGKYTKRWGPSIVSQTLGCGILAACNMFRATLDKKYLDIAKEYASEVIACQEKEYIGDSKIRGFFYEDKAHKYVLSYEHRGHEEYVVTGLCELCKLMPNDSNFSSWENSLKLYREYILSTISYTSPYSFLPGHIYFLDKINLDHFTIPAIYKDSALDDFKRQIKEGVKITDNCYLRRMPIAIQRRGFLATLLSKAKAVSSLASYFNDDGLRQIAIYQIEHVHGRNPFATSLMYGVGYNYHPLYVAYSNQMVGSLPVGIKTLGDKDAPYWPAYDNAVFKEIWGHTTGKYLAVIADLIK